MPIRAVVPSPPRSLVRATLPLNPRAYLSAAVAERTNVLMAIGASDAAVFDAMSDMVTRIGRSDERNVARAALRAPHVALLALPIHDAGRARQRLLALEHQVGKSGRTLVAIMVVPDAIFSQMWKEAGDDAGGEAGTPTESGAPTAPTPRTVARRLSSSEWETNSPEWRALIEKGGPEHIQKEFLGISKEAKQVQFHIARAAQTDERVLIQGPSGTGKDVIARLIHHLSRRVGGKFVHVNCGGIPTDLIESLILGHAAGAFTGAVADHEGHVVEASKGTLFLDEVADLPLIAQAKLLTVLDTGVVRPIGSKKAVRTDVRYIAATNRSLSAMVARGEFRFDLWMRLRGRVISTPPLNSRPGDIPMIAHAFWSQFVAKGALPLPGDVIALLQQHEWQGNVRELEMNLCTLFDPQRNGRVTVADVREVWASQDESEHDEQEPGRVDARKDLSPEYLRCQSHITAAMDAFRQAQIHMRDPMRGAVETSAAWELIAQDMKAQVSVLEALCRTPSGFYYTPVYESVRETKRMVWGVSDGLLTSRLMALRTWAEVVEERTDETISVLFSALQSLKSDVWPLRFADRRAPLAVPASVSTPPRARPRRFLA